MRQDGRPHRGWRRKGAKPKTDPATVFRELSRRELRDLDTCRRVWEQEGDPLALCEAVRQANLPEWLAHALLVMLTEGTAAFPSLRPRWWRERTRHATDGERVAQIAMVRSHPDWPNDEWPTWEVARAMGDRLTRDRYDDMPPISDVGLKRSYERVCRGLQHPGRYYRARSGMQNRIREAWAYQLGLIEAALKTRK